MTFVSVFFSFAIALLILNLEKKRKTFSKIHQFTLSKAIILIINGFIGGVKILNFIKFNYSLL